MTTETTRLVRGAFPGATLLFSCFAVVWLNPLAGGPSAGVQPMLIALMATSVAYAGLDRSPRSWLSLAFCALVWSLLLAWGDLAAPSSFTGLLAACGVIVMWASISSGRDQELASVFSAAVLAVALLSSLIAMCQYFGVSRHFEPWMSSAPVGEAYGNLRQRNQLASLTSMGFAVILLGPARLPMMAWPALVLLLAANAATASRIGLTELVLTGVAAWLWGTTQRRCTMRVLLFSAAIYAALAYVLPLLIEHFQGLRTSNVMDRVAAQSGCSSRLVLWTNVLHLISMKPWLGWGWTELDYAHYLTLYSGERFCDILDNAHNLPLHLAVEFGVPVAVLGTGLAVWFVVRRTPWREQDPTRRLAWLLLMAITLHSMVEYPLWYGPFQMTLGVCVGLLWRSPGGEPDRKASGLQEAGVAIVGRCSVALFAGVGALYAAWDYDKVSQIYLPAEQRRPAYRTEVLSRISDSWLFRDQVRFAVLTTTPLTRGNAAEVVDITSRLLHFSPEPRVIEPLIEGLLLLGREDEALGHLARFRAAFPETFDQWRRDSQVSRALTR